MITPSYVSRRLVLGLQLLLAITGCASFSNTPQQEYTLDSYNHCRNAGGTNQPVMLDRIEPDGRYWYRYYSAYDQRAFTDCMTAYRREHPYLDWVKARPNAKPGALAAAPASGVGAEIQITGNLPVWKVGDEWQFAYKSPSDSGTYVWSVNRIETLDGDQHYVIKTGTREIFYRTTDFAGSIERVDGVVVLRNSPLRTNFVWPIALGKTWEQSYRVERPVDRSTSNQVSVWQVESEETVSVPAGTFRSFKIVLRNKNTGTLIYEMWYAPEAKQWVKIREVLPAGIRERELVDFKLAK
jgi:hypothetical protein